MLVSDNRMYSNIARMLPRVPSLNILLIVLMWTNLHNWFLKNVKATWYQWLLDKVKEYIMQKRIGFNDWFPFGIALDIDQDAQSPTVAVMSLPSTSIASMQENGMYSKGIKIWVSNLTLGRCFCGWVYQVSPGICPRRLCRHLYLEFCKAIRKSYWSWFHWILMSL